MQTTSSKSPLIYWDNNINAPPALIRYIKNCIINNNYPDDSCWATTARKTTRLCAIFLAACAQGGMININYDAADGNEGLGVVLTASNLTTFGSFYAYCSWLVLEDAFKTSTPEEVEIFRSQLPNWVRTSLKICTALIGAFSQIPMAYATYKANSNSLFFAITRFLDAGLPIRSLYLGARALLKNLNLSPIERNLEKSRDSFLSILRNKKSSLPYHHEGLVENEGLLEMMQVNKLESDDISVDSGQEQDYLRTLLTISNENLPPEAPLIKTSQKVMHYIGHLSNLFVMALYGIITYHAMSLITDNEELKILSVIVVIACKFYLWKESISQAGKQLPNDLARICGVQPKPTISQAFMPKTDAVATCLSYAVGAFSYGSMKYFCNLYNLGTFFTFASSSATALLAVNTFSTLKKGAIQKCLSKFGTQEQKNVIDISNKIDKLLVAIEDTNRFEWAKFVSWLPDNLRVLFCPQELNENDILNYIRSEKKHDLKITQTNYNSIK